MIGAGRLLLLILSGECFQLLRKLVVLNDEWSQFVQLLLQLGHLIGIWLQSGHLLLQNPNSRLIALLRLLLMGEEIDFLTKFPYTFSK